MKSNQQVLIDIQPANEERNPDGSLKMYHGWRKRLKLSRVSRPSDILTFADTRVKFSDGTTERTAIHWYNSPCLSAEVVLNNPQMILEVC